jgi:hypothetical protein
MGGDIRKVTGTNQQYRKFPMPRFLVLGIAILLLSLPLFSPGSAMAVTVKKGTVIQKGAPSKAPPTAAPAKTSQPSAPSAQAAPAKSSRPSSPSVNREVVNIVVDKIEGGAMYARDGGKFEITSATRVINNSHLKTRMRTAELSFENGTLVTVILK